jgi:cation:H+ antiporter
MLIALLLLLGGLALTVYGANWLVDGASSLAKKMNVSNLVIGLTVVAFGTSMPEFVVSFISSLNGNTDIAIGNVVGSNIVNILLILGVSAMVYPITVQHSTVWKEIPFTLLAALVLFFMANDFLIDGDSASFVSRIDGLILLCFFLIFIYYSYETSKNSTETELLVVKIFPLLKSIFLLVIGIGALIAGGKLFVTGAVDIARELGISEAVIGLTVVAVGTSVPELATSVVAALKKNSDIAMGNVVGSNIFNIFFILGTSATISPLPFNPSMNTDLLICIAASLLLFGFMFTGQKSKINRMEGALFTLAYIGYTVYLVIASV